MEALIITFRVRAIMILNYIAAAKKSGAKIVVTEINCIFPLVKDVKNGIGGI